MSSLARAAPYNRVHMMFVTHLAPSNAALSELHPLTVPSFWPQAILSLFSKPLQHLLFCSLPLMPCVGPCRGR